MQFEYIFGQTPLNEDEKQGLIPSLIVREDLNEFEQENIIEARKWVMQKSILSQDVFTEEFILKLHKNMFKHVWKWAGKYRKTNKNIGIESYMISTELYKLLGDIKYWLENNIYNINDLAVICHHRLVKIHLFSNGNGRHARLFADVVIKKYNGKTLTWGGKGNLTNPDEIRKKYISALKEADYGNYESLIKFANN